jgi:hypothetical protein
MRRRSGYNDQQLKVGEKPVGVWIPADRWDVADAFDQEEHNANPHNGWPRGPSSHDMETSFALSTSCAGLCLISIIVTVFTMAPLVAWWFAWWGSP